MSQTLIDPNPAELVPDHLVPDHLAPAELAPDDRVPDVVARCRPTPARAAAAARALGVPAPPIHEHPELVSEPHLRLVDRSERTPTQRRRRTRAILVGSAVTAFAIAFALVYLHVLMAQRQFQLDNLNSQLQQQQLTYQKLRLEVAELGAPQNIISTAEGRLGMVQPASVTYLTPSTTIAGTPSTASAPGQYGGGVTQAPQGDANWPTIKSQLAGSP
jgi:cell division protein FtsL